MFLIDMFNKKMTMPSAETALPGRPRPIETADLHVISARSLLAMPPAGFATIYLGLGNFWAAERLFWNLPGIWVTAVGFQGGFTPNPTFQEVMTGLTGHACVVKIVYDRSSLPLHSILKLFFEAHDPTQGMRQGNDIGTMFRSVIFGADQQSVDLAIRMRDLYQSALLAAGRRQTVTTTITIAPEFYHAEEYHQQYLARNVGASAVLRGTGVPCPVLDDADLHWAIST
ncbi:peptide-methionine (S)-S-oxide reductase MsrA [Ciceribacter sp. L1K22]|uniref:peptide-methionine (S)-S-oxide reductase MsrA n=1 Tax=Ciceribacter sp. L1K22 TaxID=2820275 RepID=UPI001ABEABF3|nr:peptide-methionine (S)-S-oxide reductase MsrA [Ciceribacter sp. L1K22]MBO3758581.1 peptide-methionine (S)-S-oxide reductase MsrA [Ciceribacter sp. L1K22]